MSASLTSFNIGSAGSSLQRLFKEVVDQFWRSHGAASSYLDFLLSEVDPLWSQKQMRAEIVRIEQETSQCKTFVLRPAQRWSGFEAGQYVNVGVNVAGAWLRRNYSLSLAPDQFVRTGLISITVKQVADGVVSNALCEQANVGDTILISEALGSFTLDHAAHEQRLFIAAGSGITPIIAMLESQLRLDTEQAVNLLYDVRCPEDVIFAKRLEQLALRHEHFRYRLHFSATDGYLTQHIIQQSFGLSDALKPVSRAVYLCGPEGFMTSVKAHLQALGIQDSEIRQEHFSSPKHNRNAQGTAQVWFEKSGRQIESSDGRTLLELAEQAGLQPKFGCRQGICHECSCARGTGALIDARTGQDIPEDQQVIQSCMAVPVGEVRLTHW
jgi:ferredoxin-NADP reductase